MSNSANFRKRVSFTPIMLSTLLFMKHPNPYVRWKGPTTNSIVMNAKHPISENNEKN